MSVRISRATLGQQLPGMADLLTQLSNLLTDPTPGGLDTIRTQATAVIGQLRDELERVEGAQATLEGHISMMEEMVRTLSGALGESGVSRVEFSGQWPDVLGEIGGQASAIASPGQQTYGIMLLATTPNADRALSALIGLGRTLRLDRSPTPAPAPAPAPVPDPPPELPSGDSGQGTVI